MIIPKGTVVTIDGKVYRTLEAQVAWNKEELESLDIESLEALPGQFTELQENVSALADSVADVTEDVGGLESDMTDAQSDISGLQNRMTSAESNIGTNAQAIDQLEFDIADIRGDISGIGTELSSKQAKYLATVVTIAPPDWTLDQTNGFRATKTVAGVTATNLVQVSPDVDSIDDYSDNNIVCDSQSSDELQFHAKDVSAPPAMNIIVNVVVWRN